MSSDSPRGGLSSDETSSVIGVLICDDHPATARGLAQILDEVEGIKVLGVAFNGNEALEMAGELNPDVVIMDIYMPEVNGIEVTRKLTSQLTHTKVLILTMSNEEIDLFESLRAGATGYLTKDKDFDEILEAIRAIHRSQMVVPAGMTSRLMKALEEGDPAGLNPEERRILLLIADGKSNRDIALEMSLSERTIRRRVHDIYIKLKITDPQRAAAYASQVASLYAAQSAVWTRSSRLRPSEDPVEN